MAEIRIEKKSKPIWPWILGLLAIVIVAFFLFYDDDEVSDNEVATTGTVEEGGRAAGMAENEKSNEAINLKDSENECFDRFSTFVSEKSADAKAGINHEYTHDGLNYLSCSLDALINQKKMSNTNLENALSELKQAADAVQQQPESEQHANLIKKAFKESAELMEAIQKESYPELKEKVEEVKMAAKELETNNTTLEQKEELGQFFEKAHQVVSAMRGTK